MVGSVDVMGFDDFLRAGLRGFSGAVPAPTSPTDSASESDSMSGSYLSPLADIVGFTCCGNVRMAGQFFGDCEGFVGRISGSAVFAGLMDVPI